MIAFRGIIGGTVLAWGAWVFVILRFDPALSGWIGHLFFYASLGLAVQGSLMIAGFFWRKKQTGIIASRREIGQIARQAWLGVVFALVSLILASRQLLKWWSVLPLALLIIVIELFFISLQKPTFRRMSTPPPARQ